MADGTQVGHI